MEVRVVVGGQAFQRLAFPLFVREVVVRFGFPLGVWVSQKPGFPLFVERAMEVRVGYGGQGFQRPAFPLFVEP
jgi:hypothetical protein